mgnify:CR=1 FL=1
MGIKATQFHLDPQFGGTLQKQIQQMVSQGILAGRFLPGERMPSSRMLAQQLGVSRVTVTLAYAELVASEIGSRQSTGNRLLEPDIPIRRTCFGRRTGVVTSSPSFTVSRTQACSIMTIGGGARWKRMAARISKRSRRTGTSRTIRS